MKYVFLPAAEADLDRLYDFLVTRNPDAAERAMAAIRRSLGSIRENALIGTPLHDVSEHRNVVIKFGKGAYILRYRVEGDTVFVTRIWHGRENRDDTP